MYGVLAVVIIVVAKFTSGDMARAIVGAVAFFVVATAWSFQVWRRKLREAELEARRRR